jgi:hypothetical protein
MLRSLTENIFHVHTAHRIWDALQPHIQKLHNDYPEPTFHEFGHSKKGFSVKHHRITLVLNARQLHPSFPDLDIHIHRTPKEFHLKYEPTIDNYYVNYSTGSKRVNKPRIEMTIPKDLISPQESKYIFIHEYTHYNDDMENQKKMGVKAARKLHMHFRSPDYDPYNDPREIRAHERATAWSAREAVKKQRFYSLDDLKDHLSKGDEKTVFQNLKDQSNLNNYMNTLVTRPPKDFFGKIKHYIRKYRDQRG